VRTPRLLRATLVAAALVLTGAAAPAAAQSGVHSTARSEPDRPAVEAAGGCASSPTADQFEFASFDATYLLGRDDERRSTLHTTEHLVAVFPEIDQNRGIRRALVEDYAGHPTHIEIVSVTDENGLPRSYTTERDAEFLLVTIAEPCGTYVHGEQHYVIEYTQRDVTRYFENTDDDEFYWDLNGIGWAQPFGSVSGRIELDPALETAIAEGESCYYGYEGSRTECPITRDGTVFESEVGNIVARQNVTMVVVFAPGTFAAAPFDLFYFVPPLAVAGLGSSLLALILALVLRFAVWRGARGTGIVIAQYEPPDGVSPLLAANIVGAAKRGMAAAIVELAVQRKIRIIEREGSWGRTTFGVQKLDDSGLEQDQQRVMSALFGGDFDLPVGLRRLLVAGGVTIAPDAADGSVRWLQKGDTALGQRVVALRKSAAAAALFRRLRRKPPTLPIVGVGALVVLGFLLCLFAGMNGESEIAIVIGVLGTIAGSWLGVLSLVMLGAHRPLTPSGAELREHLDGLREYIRLAEADRIRMLQSVSGAERLEGPDGAIVKVYEKLLPYAVLFGLEKEWAAEIAKYYDENPPDWYDGNVSGFHVAAFAASMGALSSSVSTTYSGSSSSSSSGGSGGGGSSGGGGGGGGGGGV
jgi:uncharacterized membrane protein YgcG